MMSSDALTRKELIRRLSDLRSRVKQLEQAEIVWRQKESILREKELRYDALIGNSTEGVWHIGTDGYTIYLNRAMRALLEVDGHEELSGIKYDRFFPPRSLEIVKQEHAKRGNGIASRYDAELVGLKGTKRNVIISGTPILSDRGELQGLIGIFTDISERIQTTDALKKANEKFRALIDTSPVAITLLDKDGNIALWSPAAQAIFGWTEDELIGRPNPIIPEDKQKEYAQHLQHVMNGNPITGLEVIRLRKDGSPVNLLLSVAPLYGGKGETYGLLGMMSDITDRKRAEDELRYSEQRFRELSEAAFEGIAFTRHGIFIDVNSRLAEMFGYTVSEMIGRKVIEFVAPEARGLVSERIQSGFEGPYEHFAQRSDGRIFPVEIQARKMHFKDETIRVSAVRDITVRKDLEEQLRQSHKMEAIGTLAGGIAHEFNNILSIIIGNTELAMVDLPEWVPGRSNLEEAKSACVRAKDVVRQLLSFARKTDEQRKPVRIDTIIADTLKLLRSSIPANIEIRHTIPEAKELILADATQLNQILINLCANAVQAMEKEGGLLEIDLELVTMGRSMASGLDIDPGPYVKLIIKDNGHGIASEHLDRIFDPYFTTREVGKGSGMGLAVVHGIVINHKGAITIDSTPGEGARFDIYLPVSASEAAPEPATDDTLPAGTESLLFVDDEEIIATTSGEMLDWLGYHVHTTTSPQEALDLIRSEPHRYDLVITDYAMPKMTGDMLLKAILEIRPDLPVILCTGYSEKIDASKATALGASGYIEKPHQMRKLASKVRQVLDGNSI